MFLELYISDLDGTLMCDSCSISERTVQIINRLIDQGLDFTIATARSYESARKVVEPLNLKLPLILNNGVFVYKPETKELLVSNLMDGTMARELIEVLEENNLMPFVFTTNEMGVNKAFYKELQNEGARSFLSERLKNGDKRFELVDNFDDAFAQDIYNIVCIGGEQLAATNSEIAQRFDVACHYYRDIYTDNYWLEMNASSASKRTGVAFLKTFLGAETVTCFGDNLNDLPMFEVADCCYAVGNSEEAVKSVATAVIGNNKEDGVAEFLLHHFEENRRNNR